MRVHSAVSYYYCNYVYTISNQEGVGTKKRLFQDGRLQILERDSRDIQDSRKINESSYYICYEIAINF